MALQPLAAPVAFALEKDAPAASDIAAPSAPTNGLPNNEAKRDTTFSFSWAASTDEPAITYWVRVSPDRAQVGNAPDTSQAWYSSNLVGTNLPAGMVANFGSGVWYWQVRAMDVAGNKSMWSDVWTVTVDVARPTIEILHPLEGSLPGGASISFGAVITDTSELAFVAVELDGQDITAQIQRTQTETGMHLQTEWRPRELADGNHTLRVVAKDIHDHASDAIRSFAVDTKPPEITTTITDGQILKGVVSLDLTANETGVYTIRIMANEHELLAQGDTELQTESATRHTRVWNTQEVADGRKYTITFAGKDEAGNESVVTRQVTVANAVTAGIVTVKDPLLEELSTSLSQPLATPQLIATTPRVALGAFPDSSNMVQPYDELLDAIPEFAPVAATENGWRLFGVLWHWWMLGGLFMASGVTYVWRSARAALKRQLPDSV